MSRWRSWSDVDLLGLLTRVVPPRRPPRVDPADVRRVLVIKLSSIGDVVQALPVASALRRAYPTARITWAVEEWTAPLVRGHPAVDRVVVLPRLGRDGPAAWRDAVRALRAEPYDVSLDLQGLLRSAVVAGLAGAALRLGLDGQREGAHLVSAPIPLPPGRVHAVEEYLAAATYLGAPAAPVRFDLRVEPAAERTVAHRLVAAGISPAAALVVLAPSASTARKGWAAVRWARVADALAPEAAVVLAGTPAQRTAHATIARHARGPVHDLTGETSLAELVALLERAALVIAPDTGAAHVAAALGRPVVGIYGPTPPWRLRPRGVRVRVVHHPGLCGALCPRPCLYGRRCLDAIGVEEVVRAAREVVMSRPRRGDAYTTTGTSSVS